MSRPQNGFKLYVVGITTSYLNCFEITAVRLVRRGEKDRRGGGEGGDGGVKAMVRRWEGFGALPVCFLFYF
jgi:hypothetical protein